MALWNKELASLDAERERRKEEGYKPDMKAIDGNKGNSLKSGNPNVRRITLKELEEIERRARAEMSSGSGTGSEIRKGAQKQKGGPSKAASAVM